MMSNQPEPWLRGPLAGIPPLLQPPAHAFIMAREDAAAAAEALTPLQLWSRPGGAASIGFHLAHLAGSTDRLLTYARGESLSPVQFAALRSEQEIDALQPRLEVLLEAWHSTVDAALLQIGRTAESTLLDRRTVGRSQLPSTVLGLIFHAAEHAQRHVGQIITTAKIVRGA